MLVPPEVLEKIRKEQDRQNQIRIPLQPEIPLGPDRLQNPNHQKKKKRPVPLIIDLA